MLGEQDQATGYWLSPVAFEGARGNLMSGEDPKIDMLVEAVDVEEEWNLDGAIGGESA